MPSRVAAVAPDISPYRADSDDTEPDADDPSGGRRWTRGGAWEVVGAIGGAAGVLLAVFLAWYGGYQVRKERRIIHEIDVLRDLVARTDDAMRGAGSVSAVRGYLLILDDPAACPVLRVFASANPTPEGLAAYRDLLQNAGDLLRDAGYDHGDPHLDPRSRQFDPTTVWLAIRDACLAEIEAAISARLQKPRRVTIDQARVEPPSPATCTTPQRRLPYT